MDSSSTHQLEELLVHGAWLRRLASRLVAADGEADDLVQETWLAALARWPGRRGDSKAWLARVLRNKASSRARTLGSRQRCEHEHARAESLPSAAALASRADTSRRLVELVLELPRDPQRILLARYFEGLSSAEIARRLGRPTASVRSQLKRGLDELRIRLDAESEGERERWLSLLTPLVSPGLGGNGLGTVLAASAGLRVVVCLGLVLAAAGVWWMNRGPGSAPPPPPVVADGSSVSPDEVRAAAREDERPAAAVSPARERTALEADDGVVESVIEGRLVHPRTGEAVIWFELGIVPSEEASLFRTAVTAGTQMPEPERMELVRTDEAGRFVSRSEYPSGSYALVPIEDWRVARTPVDLDRIRQPRAPEEIEHDASAPDAHTLELETGPVFVVDCPKALELGAENMVAIYSHLDHFPPGYFRPSPLQVDPAPFVRMHTDFAPSHRNQVTNLRLVSADGFWSGSVPMEVPDSIATRHVSFDLEARALVDVELDFGERKPPLYLALHYWRGAVDPTAEDAPDPDIVELQAKFDGTDLERAIVKYVPTGLATVGIEATTSEYWFRVVELSPGYNSLEAVVVPDPTATGRIEGRVVHVGRGSPEQIVRVIANATVNGEPTFQSRDLVFEERDGVWTAEFALTHLPVTPHTLWFDKGGPASREPKAFAVEPDRVRVEVDGPPVEFELHTDLTRTRLVVKVRDGVSGDKIRDFALSVFVPGNWVRSRRAESKAGRATMKLIGDLEGGMASLAAEGYVRRDVPLSDADESSKGLELELEMTPGWGGPVYINHADTDQPLAGVRVLLDGAPIGVTDEAGQFRIEVPSAPRRVDFELDGYVVTGQAGWVDGEGEVIPVGLDPIRQYIGVSMRER